MAMVSPSLVIFLLLISLSFFSPSLAEIRFSDILNDDRPIIPLDQFGFTDNGRLELNVSKISLSNSNIDLSKVGFFLVTLDSWLHVLQQLEDGEIRCALQSDFIRSVYTFNSLNNDDSFYTLYKHNDADEYNLVFADCYQQQLKVSMHVRSAMYNLDGKSQACDYLSAGRTILPRVYFLFSVIYFALAAIWNTVLYRKRLTVFRIHFFMLAVLILKALTLLCEAKDKFYIRLTGSAHGWDLLFYIFSFLNGISLFTLIVLIGIGWSFLKPFLQDKVKVFIILMIVIPLQVVANIAQVVIDETGLYGHDWVTWKQVSLLVDVVCCCAVLFPIRWSIKNLREAARTEGKVARHYFAAVICYIFFTRVVIYALETMTSYRHAWTSVVVAELATLALYVFTGYKFKPEAHNVTGDDEKKAAAKALKLDDEF